MVWRTKRNQLHDAVIRVYDAAGKVIETHQHAGRIQRVVGLYSRQVTLAKIYPHRSRRDNMGDGALKSY